MNINTFPKRLLIFAVLLALTVVGYLQLSSTDEEGVHRPDMSSERMQDMGGVAAISDTPQLMNLAPLVKGYYDGDELFFIHTEASDRQVATMLTEMMGPQVVLVPRLAETPASLRAEVYVFQNGVGGMGPFGYQPDVFSSAPGTEGYSPLRAIHLVNWNAEATPRELRSVEEVHAAASRGEITINDSGVVVNMPVLVWPGGHR